jgi:hypothetical protein
MACAVIHARTVPTFQAVTRSESLIGLGNVPAFTLRHSVGALNGRGAGVSGLLGLCTSCDSRINALSGSASKTEWLIDVLAVGMLDEIGALGVVGLLDILGYLMSEGPIVKPYA